MVPRSEPLTPFEWKIVGQILSGVPCDCAQRQLDALRVVRREHTGAGVFIALEATTQRACADLPSGMIGNVSADGGEVGFLLFARDGRLTLLEGYTVLEAWPADVEVRTFEFDRVTPLR